MYRLLNAASDAGMVAVDYHQQWRTFFKAQALGYVNEDGYLTEAGTNYVMHNAHR